MDPALHLAPILWTQTCPDITHYYVEQLPSNHWRINYSERPQQDPLLGEKFREIPESILEKGGVFLRANIAVLNAKFSLKRAREDSDKSTHKKMSLVPTLTRSLYCKHVLPDVTFIVGGKIMAAHRSILCYFFKEWIGSPISLPGIDPEMFSRLLDWVYTDTFEWKSVPAPTDTPEDVFRKIQENLEMLEAVKKLAEKYSLAALKRKCESKSERLNQLSKAATNPSLLTQIPLLFQEKTAPPDFSGLVSHDVYFKAGDMQFSGSRLILTTRSLFFRDLLQNDPGGQTAQEPIHLDSSVISPDVFKIWIDEIEKGLYLSPTIHSRSAKTARRIAALNIDQASSFLKVAELESDPINQGLYLLFKTHMDDKFKVKLMRWLEKNGNCVKGIEIINNLSITSSFLYVLIERCPELEEFEVSGCAVFSDSHTERLAMSGRLKILEIEQCENFSNQSLTSLVSHRVPLEELIIIDPGDLTEEHISALVRACPTLRCLCISGIENISIKPLTQHARQLSFLDVSYCSGVTADALIELAKALPLDNLGIVGIEVDRDVLAELIRQAVTLRTLTISVLFDSEDLAFLESLNPLLTIEGPDMDSIFIFAQNRATSPPG